MRVGLKKQRSRVCFTLLELVIVAVIVSILASLGVGYYRKVIIKAKVGKAKHAISLIVEAEKIYELDNGIYVAIVAGAVDATVGTNVTGINLAAVDNDTDFKYSVTGAGLVQAKNPVPIGTCGVNTTISFNLAVGTWTIPACYQ